MKISAKGDPVLTFSLPGGACRPLAPRQLRHCLVWDSAFVRLMHDERSLIDRIGQDPRSLQLLCVSHADKSCQDK